MSDNRQFKKQQSIKASRMVIAVVATVSISGFFMGMRQTVRESEVASDRNGGDRDEQAQHGHTMGNYQPVKTAVSYGELSHAGLKPNTNWTNHIKNLTTDGILKDHGRNIDFERDEKRNARRAYNGAPPTVPHPIDQHESDSCVVCHSHAVEIDSVVAPQMSHPYFQNCIQCHVSSQGLGSRWNTSSYDLHTGNGFTGAEPGQVGDRAYDGAPPTIPHTIWMRQECMSCHGPLGTAAIRTSHPDRSNCVQCHAPNAGLEQRNGIESAFPIVEEFVKPLR